MAARVPRPCACSCGTLVRGATYAPGHGPPPRRSPSSRYATGAQLRRHKREVLERSGGLCHVCRRTTCPHCGRAGADVVDHVIPVAAGNSVAERQALARDPANLAAAHRCCNAEKSNRLP
jgi:5-methylcytosine-specific restriction endonuclease McrA